MFEEMAMDCGHAAVSFGLEPACQWPGRCGRQCHRRAAFLSRHRHHRAGQHLGQHVHRHCDRNRLGLFGRCFPARSDHQGPGNHRAQPGAGKPRRHPRGNGRGLSARAGPQGLYHGVRDRSLPRSSIGRSGSFIQRLRQDRRPAAGTDSGPVAADPGRSPATSSTASKRAARCGGPRSRCAITPSRW